MSLNQPSCFSTGSTERPMILVSRLSNSGLILAMYPSSVVQIGVKSFGCEKSTAHESPIHSWKLISPSVVSAVKSGAVSFSCNAMCSVLPEYALQNVWIQNHNAPRPTGIQAGSGAPQHVRAGVPQEVDSSRVWPG